MLTGSRVSCQNRRVIHLIVAAALVAGSSAGATPAFQKPAAAVQAPARQIQAKQVSGKPGATAKPQTDTTAEAYYEFLLAHHKDQDGDSDGALAGFRRALALDPTSSQITTELAEFYARQGEIKSAVELADAALKLDPDNFDAHRILGMLYAELATRESTTAGSPDAAAKLAIEHLEKALGDDRVDVASEVRLQLGRVYLRDKTWDKAIAVLKQLLADNPWLPRGVAMLNQAYVGAGKNTEAIALLKDAVEEEPGFYPALADAYEKQRLFTEAADAYEQASILNPRDADLKTRWASALLSEEEEASTLKARDLLAEVTKANPTATWALYLLSRAQRELGNLDGAETAARQVLAASPNSISGAHALAQVYESRREYARLVEALAPIVAAIPKGRDADAALLLTHLGTAYMELGKAKDAVAAFERAAQLSPQDAMLKAYVARALVADKQFDKALAMVRERRSARPDNVELARLEAEALRGSGSFDAGVAVLKPFAEKAPSGVGVQSLAEYYAAAGRYAEAAALLKAGVAKFPDDLDVQFQYGAMLERQKLFAEAERVLRKVIAADGEHAAALNYLGYTMVERGERVAEALTFIQRAIKLDPYNGSYLDSLGWAYFKLKQFEQAEAPLQRASDQLVRDSVVQDHFGDVLAARSRWKDAVAAWQRALAGDRETIDPARIESKIRDAQRRIGKE